MGVIIRILPELEKLSASELAAESAKYQAKLEAFRLEAQELSNTLAAIAAGAGDPSDVARVSERARSLELDKLATEIRIREIDIATFTAWTRETEGEMNTLQAAIDKAESELRRAEGKRDAARAPYWKLFNDRKGWDMAQSSTARDLAQLRSEQAAIVRRAAGNLLPAPEPDFLRALSEGRVRTADDLPSA